MKRFGLALLLSLCVVGTASAGPLGYWSEYYNPTPGSTGSSLFATSCELDDYECLMDGGTFTLNAWLIDITNVEQIPGGTRYTTEYGDYGQNDAFFQLGDVFPTLGTFRDDFSLRVVADIGMQGEYLGGVAVGSARNYYGDLYQFSFSLQRLGFHDGCDSNIPMECVSGSIGHYGTLESVPEPVSTLTLLGGALLALVQVRRKLTK